MNNLYFIGGVIGLIILIVWLAKNGLSAIDAITIGAFIVFLAWFVLTQEF